MRASGTFKPCVAVFVVRVVCGVVMAVLLGGVDAQGTAAEVKSSQSPVKGPRDERSYRYLTLDNRMRVLLISDPDSDKAAAALDIRVGSRHDPDDHLGLAHFLEHMLFLGTEKFPEAGEYQRYIQQHGGSNNASTSFEHTNYYFEIDNAHLPGALGRFSQFFVAPLFNETYVNRERHAVNSEYQARLKSDGSRGWDAMKQVFNPDHPVSRFTVGNLDTLSTPEASGLSRALRDFWNTQYSANRMTLAVYSAGPLEQMQASVESLFGPIKDRDLPLTEDRVAVPMFAPGRLPAVLEVVPERDLRTVSLNFPMPPVRPDYRAKPTYFLSNILGHEGKGSLLSALKNDGWSDGLSSGLSFGTQDSSMFRINIRLTEQGLAHVPDVIGRVFQLSGQMRHAGVERWRQQEQKHLLALGFQFQEPSSPVGYAVDLARSMHFYPAAEVLEGPYLLTDFDATVIEKYLQRLTPDNMLVVLTSKQQRAERKSPYFDTPYRISAVPEEWVAHWQRQTADPSIRLPTPNLFVPESLALIDDSENGQKILAGRLPIPMVRTLREGLLFAHGQDVSFRVPKVNVYVSVRSPAANDSVRHNVLTSLYARLVRDQLQEFSYPASLAGLGYALYPHLRGITLRLSGYSDKVDVLLKAITQRLRDPGIVPGRFRIEVDDMRRGLANQKKDRSFRLAMREVSRMLLAPSWSVEDKLRVLEDVTPSELAAFVPQLFASLNVVVLVHGNVTRTKAEAFAEVVRLNVLSDAKITDVARGAVSKLLPGERVRRVFPVEHQDSGIALYYQGRSRLTLERARFALLAQISSAPFYLQLRTQKQLGYVVFASGTTLVDVPGISFVIQSPGTPSAQLERHIRDFLTTFEKTLTEMSDGEFDQHKAGLLNQILEKDKTLRERSDRYWNEIDRRRFSFDSPAQLASAVRGLDQAGFISFFRDALLGDNVREISAWAIGAAHEAGSSRVDESENTGGPDAVPTAVSSPEEFKKGRSFYTSR